MTLEHFANIYPTVINLKGVCMPAAVDAISKRHTVPIDVYKKYSDIYMRCLDTTVDPGFFEDTLMMMFRRVGVKNFNQVELFNPYNTDEFMDIITRANRDEKRILLRVGKNQEHTLGLRKFNANLRTVGMRPIYEGYSPKRLFEQKIFPSEDDKPVILLPRE